MLVLGLALVRGALLPPATALFLIARALHGEDRIAGGEGGVTLAVFLHLGAFLHQPLGGVVHAPALKQVSFRCPMQSSDGTGRRPWTPHPLPRRDRSMRIPRTNRLSHLSQSRMQPARLVLFRLLRRLDDQVGELGVVVGRDIPRYGER